MTDDFKPLPSDIIQDPECWPEWELNEKFQVVRKPIKFRFISCGNNGEELQ